MPTVDQGTDRNTPVFSSTETETLQITKTPTVYILRCIPAKSAFLVSSGLLLVCADLLCATGWIIARRLNNHLTDMQKIAFYFHILNCVFLCGISLLGLYAGARSKKPKHTQLFAALLLGQIIFGIASGAWCLRIIFTAANPGGLATECATTVHIGFLGRICRRPALVKGFSLVAFVVLWILEIVAIYVANRFAKQLREGDLQKTLSSPTSDEYLY